MDMIGHNNKFIQFNMGEMLGDLQPILRGNRSKFRKDHCIIDYFSKKAVSVLATNSYEIYSL
jgi:hypothetical protein